MVDFLQILQNYRVYVYYIFFTLIPTMIIWNIFPICTEWTTLYLIFISCSLFGLWFLGMNSSVRAVVRMGSYLGCKVFYIKEVRDYTCRTGRNFKRFVCIQNYVPVHVWFTSTCTFMNLKIMKIRRKYR